jgi:hypothetical protein
VNDRELDAEFERIIAGWDEETTDPQPQLDPTRPEDAATVLAVDVPADVDPSPAAASDGPGDAPSDPPGDPATGLTLSIAPTTPHVWRAAPTPADDVDEVLEATDPDDGHFEPPTLTELPKAEDDPMFWAIVGGLGGGPLLLLYLLIFDRDGSGWWVATALAMTVVGFVLLVLRGGNERDPFDDGTRV